MEKVHKMSADMQKLFRVQRDRSINEITQYLNETHFEGKLSKEEYLKLARTTVAPCFDYFCIMCFDTIDNKGETFE